MVQELSAEQLENAFGVSILQHACSTCFSAPLACSHHDMQRPAPHPWNSFKLYKDLLQTEASFRLLLREGAS